ncbi:MAG: DMT family transporter [Alistipes sp.]|nr:DMT family transporter [Alistipes sp.]
MGEFRYNIALIVSNILFGVSFSVYVSLLRDTLSFEQLFAIQLLFSTVVFAPLAIVKPGFFALSLNDFGSIFIVALLVIFGWWYLLIAGASFTNPVDASTITTIGPLFTLIVAMIVESRRATKGEAIGIIVALLGIFALLYDRGRSLVNDGEEGYGNSLILCAVVAIATNTVLITPVLRRHGTVVVMGWYYIIGSLLALPILITEIPQLASTYFSLVGVLELGYILLFGSWLPIYLLYIGSEHLTPTHTALYRYIQPVIATTMAVIRGQTIIDRTNIVGAVLIFVGMLCVIRFSPRTTTPTRV